MNDRNYRTISICLAALLIMGAVFTGAQAIAERRSGPQPDMEQLAALAGPLHESAVSLTEGSRTVRESADTLASGLGSLTDSNEMLINEAQQAFYALLDSGDRHIAALDFEAPELTALNYSDILDSLSTQPGGVELADLKRELDSYVQFYTDLTDYTDSVALASKGARTVEEGMSSVENLAGIMAGSTAELFGGMGLPEDGVDAISDSKEEIPRFA